MANNLITLGLDVTATQERINKQLQQITKNLSNGDTVRVTAGLNLTESQNLIQQQLNSISKNLKINVGTVNIDTSAIKQQQNSISQQLKSGINSAGVKIPFQFDLSDANAVKSEINKIVAEITKNKGQLVKYKIIVDDSGKATKALLTYKNELNETTQATLKLKEVGKWYDSNGMEHSIVQWQQGQKVLSQNIESTIKTNQRQIESDNQVIRKREELIAQMKLLNTQAEKAGISLNSDNQNAFNDLSINASTLDDIKQLESYLRLARTEYQTFNAEISKGTHASSLETMKNTLATMPNDIALIEAKFNSIKMPDNVKTQIEQLKADMEAINNISDPQAKIAKYNEMVASLQSLQKQYQVTAQEQKNLNADMATLQGASNLTNKIVSWMGQNRDAAAKYDEELKKLISDLQNCTSKTDLTRLEQQFRGVQTQVKATENASTGLWDKMAKGIKDAFTNMLKYQLSYEIIQRTVEALKAMTQAVSDLDKNLTEFNKVADLSAEQLADFSDKAYDAADKIGRTGTDMIEAATEFKRAGYDLNNSLEMGDAALVMTNVADGITQTSDAASTLISVLNGFNVNESDVMTIVDKMNSVSNQSPVGFDNLADGLERVSGTMNQAGNSIDETIGLLTGGFTQLRNMEKVSTGLTTISQRLRAIGEDGEEIDGLSAKLGSSFGSIGVAIEDANGNLRSTYDILSDYAKVYPELTSEQRQYFGELAAGKHQITVFNAIVSEMAAVDKAIDQSKNSLNSAVNENEIWRQSVEGLRNEFQNQFQSLSKEVISSQWLKDLISAGTDFLEVITNIVKQDDLVSGTIGVITKGIRGLASVLKDITGNDVIASLLKAFITYKTITKGIDIFNFVKGKKNSYNKVQKMINAFFKDTVDGTEQVRNGFLKMDKGISSSLKSMGTFLATNPIGWAIDIAAAVVVFTKAYAKLTTSANEANDAVSESLETSQNQVQSVREQKDNVDKLTESYEKLSKGVNTATNENLTLSTDDYKEYLDTCNQIADMYPELVSGYDAQGNAILSLKGNVQGLTDAYKEAQQEAYKTAFVGVTDEDGKTTGGIKSIEDQFKLTTNKADPGDNWWDAKVLSTNNYIDTYKEMVNMSNKQLKNLRTESLNNGTWWKYKAAFDEMGIKWSDISKASEEELAKYRAQMEQQTQSFVQTQEDTVSNAKSSIEGYIKGVTDAGGNALVSGYDKLTEEQQNLVTTLLSSLDLDTLQAFEDSGDFEEAAKKWSDSLVSSVSNMSAEAKNAYNELQKSISDPDNLTSTAISQIDGYLNTLSQELNISKSKLKEIFNLDDIFDTEKSFNNVVEKFIGTDELNKLSDNAKKAADSVSDYGKSAKEATDSTSGLTENASVLSDAFDTTNIDKTKDALDNLSTVKFMTPEDIKDSFKQLDNLGDSAKKNSEKIVASVDDSGQKIQKNTEEVVGKVDTSHKEIASNIQKVYDEADKSVAQSMDNIKNRNQGVVDSIVNSDDMKHAKATINDLIESAKEYDKTMSEAGKKSQYAGISDVDNDYKNSQDKVNPWKQFGQEYLKAQQEAHKNDAAIVQAEMDNMDKLGQKAKSVWDSYIDTQKEAHKYDAQITQAQIDNANVVGDRLKSVWDKYTESQKEAHKYDAQASQASVDVVKDVWSKYQDWQADNRKVLSKDMEDAFGDKISGTVENLKKAGEAFNNNASVKYVKDTAKDLTDISSTIKEANEKAKEMAVANQSVGNLASSGIGQVISAQEQLTNVTEKQAKAFKEAQEQQKQEQIQQIKTAQLEKQQQVEKQKAEEKAAHQEKNRQRQEEIAAQKQAARDKAEANAKQWIADNIDKMTISQKKMFIEASNGADTAAQAMANYNQLLQDNALNTFSIDISEVTEHINNLNTALSESASATGLSADSITNLKSMFSGLDDYDASKLFESTANGIKLNREELEKLNQSYYDQKTDAAKEQIELLKDKYADLTAEINVCSDTTQMADLYAQRDAVKEQIDDVQSLISQYDGLTSAFNEWQNAQNETSPGANYDSVYSYIETANEMAKDGKWGNPAFKKYIEMLSGQDLSDASTKEIKAAWEGLGKVIENTGYSLGNFLTEDGTGVDKFVDMLDKLDDKYVQLDQDGNYIIDIDNMDELAKRMGTDVSFVQVLLDKLSEYNYKVNVNTDDLDLVKTKAEEANERLKANNATTYTFDFNADSDNIQGEIDKAQALFDQLKASGDTSNLADAQAVLTQLLAQREKLQRPIIMQIDTGKLDDANQKAISTLQTLQNSIDGYQIALQAGADTSDVTATLEETLDEIGKLPDVTREKLGLTSDEVTNAIETLKQNISDGVSLDTDSLDLLESQLQSIDPEILAKLGIDMDSVQKDVDATTQAFQDALTNVLDGLQISWDWDTMSVKITADTSDLDSKVENANDEVDNMHDGNSDITADNSQAEEAFDETEKRGQAYDGSSWYGTVIANADSSQADGLIQKLLNNFVKSKPGQFIANLFTSSSGSSTTSNSNSAAQKKAQSNVKSKGTRSGYEMVHHANGTFHGFAEGTFLKGYHSGTNVAIQSDEDALVNELGNEGLLRDGVLYEIPGNAHIEHLKKGDIIFNKMQLDQLRKYGYVQSGGGRGKLIGGYAYGSLTGMSGHWFADAVGKRETSDFQLTTRKSTTSKTKTTGNSGKSTTKSGSTTKTSTGDSGSDTDTTKDAEETKETLDWIETAISRVERIIKNLGKTVSATYKSWSERNNALSSELSQVNSEISIQQQAYNRYMQEANKVGLDAGYAQKVRDGKIDIETITDDNLKQKIEDYTNWYEKALDCSDAILDLKDDLYDLAQTNFDNITKQFDEQLDVITHSVNMVEGYIDLAETRGYLASTDYYDNLIKLETQNIGTLKNEYDSLANTLNNMVNAGQIKKYSEAWYDLYGQICDVEEALQDATKALSEYESKMRELKWSYFETQQNYITNFTDEMSWLNDLLEKQGKLIDDNGNMTNRGTASMGLHAVGYNTHMSQADDYAKEIQKINKELAKDPFNTILIDKRQEYLKAQRDSIDAAYDEIDAAKSLMKEGYDAQIDALDKLIEKRQNLLETERSLYDYQKSVAEKVDTISSYEKQLKAYENDNSEEGMAKRQQLQKNLKDAKTDLQETEWEQQISDIKQMMSDMEDDYSEFLNARLDDINFILNTMLDSANQNSESIKTTLTDATASVGTTLSETMNTVWTSSTGLNSIVTNYGNGFNNALTTTNAALASIEAMIKSMVQEAQKKAAEDAAKQAAAAKAAQAQIPKVNSNSNNNQNKSNSTNNSASNGSFFIHKVDGYNKSKLNKENSIVDKFLVVHTKHIKLTGKSLETLITKHIFERYMWRLVTESVW